MAPSPITEDYYLVLEVVQTATPELIVKSYRRLALKLHPDRNTQPDAKESFQLLGRAYETLKDQDNRRAYDILYPSITQNRSAYQKTEAPRPPPTAPPQSGELSDAAQIAALQKLKQERGARWQTKKGAFDSAIFELQRGILRLQQEIKILDSRLAAEAAEKAKKNSWGTWLMSPFYNKAEETEAEKSRKDRAKQERKIEKDMKERRLESTRADRKRQEIMLRNAKEEIDAADRVDDWKIRMIEARIQARENSEREDRERAERESAANLWRQQQEEREKRQREAAEARMAKYWKEQQEQRERRDRELAEALRKQQAEQRDAEQKRQESERLARERTVKFWREQQEHAEAVRKQAEQRAAATKREEEVTGRGKMFAGQARGRRGHNATSGTSTRQSSQTGTSTCRHDGWWSQVQGRTECPSCNGQWTYLLQCPSCNMKACPRCQRAKRGRRTRGAARTT